MLAAVILGLFMTGHPKLAVAFFIVPVLLIVIWLGFYGLDGMISGGWLADQMK